MENAPRTRPRSRGAVQEQKSFNMRRRICDATLRALADVGYERVSTKLIAETGGMSRGAVSHHFPTRNDLLVAAFARLLEEWERDWPFTDVADGATLNSDALIDAIWRGVYANETYHAILELMLAARKDQDLGERLRATGIPWAKKRDRRTIDLLGACCDDDEIYHLLQLNLCVLRGITVNQFFEKGRSSDAALIATWKKMFKDAVREKVASTAPVEPLNPESVSGES